MCAIGGHQPSPAGSVKAGVYLVGQETRLDLGQGWGHPILQGPRSSRGFLTYQADSGWLGW